MPEEMRAADLWNAPLEDAAQTILNNVGMLDDRRATIYGAFLQAKVAVTISDSQEDLAHALVKATSDIANQTKWLVRATFVLALASVVVGLLALWAD